MTTNAPWLEHAVDRVAGVKLGPAIEEFGRVQTIADGIAMISGLPSVRLNEVLRFERGQLGFAQTLDRDLIGCVLLDGVDQVEAGDTVRVHRRSHPHSGRPRPARPRRRPARPPA